MSHAHNQYTHAKTKTKNPFTLTDAHTDAHVTCTNTVYTYTTVTNQKTFTLSHTDWQNI